MEGDGETTILAMPAAEDVVRSVFETGSSPRMTQVQLNSVLNVVRNALTRGLNPIQEDWISSSSPAYSNSENSSQSSTLPSSSRLYFWFLLSASGAIDYVSHSVSDLLGFKPRDLTSLSAYSLVSLRDHHIVLPILNSGPSTSMSCRMHFQTVNSEEIPFDVAFAKISTRQLISDLDSERSATLCVARSHLANHGQILIQLGPSANIIHVDNKCDVWLPTGDLIGQRISQLCSPEHINVLESMFQGGYDSRCQLPLLFGEIEAYCFIRLVKGNNNNINENVENSLSLLCTVTRISSNSANGISSNRVGNLPETLISQPNFEDSIQVTENQKGAAKLKKPRKPRAKKAKPIKEPIKDALLKQLLGTSRSSCDNTTTSTSASLGVASKTDEDFKEPVMYQQQGSTMSAQQPMYLNNNNNNNNNNNTNNNIGIMSNNMNGYPTNQCSSYLHPSLCAPDYPMASQVHSVPPQAVPSSGPHHPSSMMTSPNPVVSGPAGSNGPQSQHQLHHHGHPGHWPEYYQTQQANTQSNAHQVHFSQTAAPSQPVPTTKSQKRKASAPASVPERPNNPMNYGHHPPGYNYPQGGSVMELNMLGSDDMHHSGMNNHLSPYRYSSASSPYWPATGRPPSRSELVRMELRNSLQAKQLAANQQRLPALTSPVDSNPLSETHSNTPSIGSDSLGFDLDIVLKDADGSLDAELDSVYDFNLGDGCGFQFDMENDATRCLVMKLLS